MSILLNEAITMMVMLVEALWEAIVEAMNARGRELDNYHV